LSRRNTVELVNGFVADLDLLGLPFDLNHPASNPYEARRRGV